VEHDLILHNIGKHIQLNKDESDYFISLLKKNTVKKRDFLLRAGDVCKHEHFITRGCLRTYTTDDDGTEHILMFAIEDWWTGDLYSFLTQTPSAFSIDAIEDTEVLQISYENLQQLYERVPKFERFFRLILQNAFIAGQQRINQNLAFTAEEKYLHFISKFPQMEQRIPQKLVAAYLGITPEFLSMIRKKLAKK
jgi:CRP-like cAMP-binding protein